MSCQICDSPNLHNDSALCVVCAAFLHKANPPYGMYCSACQSYHQPPTTDKEELYNWLFVNEIIIDKTDLNHWMMVILAACTSCQDNHDPESVHSFAV